MSSGRATYVAPMRLGSSVMHGWLAAAIASGAVFGAAAAGVVMAINSVELLIAGLCLIAFVPGLWVSQLAKWMGVPNPRVVAVGALIGGVAAGYVYVALRLFGLYSYHHLPVTPWDVAAMWPDAAANWVQVDAYSGEESAASSMDVHMIQLGLAVALLGSLIVNPIVGYVRASWFDPFCGTCGRWVDKPVHKFFFAPFVTVHDMVRKIRLGEVVELGHLTPVSDEVADAVEFRVYQCAGCNGPFTLSVRSYRLTEKGQIARKMLLRHVAVDDELIVRLLAQGQPAGEAVAGVAEHDQP